MHKSKQREVPIWERTLLTINEASDYTGIGINRLRRLTSYRNCDLVIWVGNRRMIKRKKLDEYLENSTTV
jgi:excisionase family DNA binding protein